MTEEGPAHIGPDMLLDEALELVETRAKVAALVVVADGRPSGLVPRARPSARRRALRRQAGAGGRRWTTTIPHAARLTADDPPIEFSRLEFRRRPDESRPKRGVHAASRRQFRPRPSSTTCVRLAARRAEIGGTRHEARAPRRRVRHAPLRGDARPSQADGRDRRPPDPVAHHEALRLLRRDGVRDLLRLQGLCHQGILRQLLPPHVGRHLRPRAEPHGGASPGRRAVAGDPRRHRRRHAHRRAAQARGGARVGRGGLLLHLRRRALGHRHRRRDRLPPRAWPLRHRRRGPPAGPLRRDRDGR